MDVVTRSEDPGKSLPAELMVGGRNGLHRLMQNGEVMQHRGLRGLGYTAEEWAAMLQASTAATLPLLIAQNPGTYYSTNPTTGQVTVYAQPTGSNVTLPVGVMGGGGGVVPGGATGTLSTAAGTASVGISSTTLTMLAMAGLLGFVLMRGR